MWAILLSGIAVLLGEVSSSLAKREMAQKHEHVFSMGFLNSFSGLALFAVLALWRNHFFIAAASLPYFLARLALDVLQAYLVVHAVAKSERSTFGFVRSATIPLVLVVDMWLGYYVSPWALLGMLVIFFGLLILYKNHGINRRGLWWVAAGTVNAVITISLYKHTITRFGNNLEAEQLLVFAAQTIFFYVWMRRAGRERPLALLERRPMVLIQAMSEGLGGVFASFSYLFAPASILVAANRSFAVVFSVLFGRVWFHERHVKIKTIMTAVILLGILLLSQ